MAYDYVYTYGDIIISNYEFVKITDLRIIVHSKMKAAHIEIS